MHKIPIFPDLGGFRKDWRRIQIVQKFIRRIDRSALSKWSKDDDDDDIARRRGRALEKRS